MKAHEPKEYIVPKTSDLELWETLHRLFGEARGYAGTFDVPEHILEELKSRGFIESQSRPTKAGLDFMAQQPE
jgi:hypothetical protein